MSSSILNTDHGSQCSSMAFTEVVMALGVQVSMEGRRRWMDKMFIERLWQSLKREAVHLHDLVVVL